MSLYVPNIQQYIGHCLALSISSPDIHNLIVSFLNVKIVKAKQDCVSAFLPMIIYKSDDDPDTLDLCMTEYEAVQALVDTLVETGKLFDADWKDNYQWACPDNIDDVDEWVQDSIDDKLDAVHTRHDLESLCSSCGNGYYESYAREGWKWTIVQCEIPITTCLG